MNDSGGTVRPNVQYSTNRVQGVRLDKYGGDGLAHSANSGRNLCGFSNISVVPDKSHHNHEREEEVEREGNRKEGSAKSGEGVLRDAVRL